MPTDSAEPIHTDPADDAASRSASAHDDPLSLENQLCFSLYAATRAVRNAYKPKLEALGLTYTQYLVLIVLWREEGLTVAEIGQRLRLDSGTMTPILKRLEQRGLLTRERRASDEREVEVSLTPQGRVLRQGALGVRCQVVSELNMTTPEITSLRAELDALVSTLSDPD